MWCAVFVYYWMKRLVYTVSNLFLGISLISRRFPNQLNVKYKHAIIIKSWKSLCLPFNVCYHQKVLLVRMNNPPVSSFCLAFRSLSSLLHPWPSTLMWPSSAACTVSLASPFHVCSPFKHILLSSALSPIFSRFSASHSSFDCQLASLSAASFFDPPLLSKSLNTFNLLSSSLICHSIHPVLPFIISPYRPPPSVLLLLSARLKDGFKDPLSPLSPSTQ